MKKFLEMEENIESRTSAEGEDDVDIFQTTKVRIVFKDYLLVTFLLLIKSLTKLG